jgi:tetratricopeptide (TPR) repeat protein
MHEEALRLSRDALSKFKADKTTAAIEAMRHALEYEPRCADLWMWLGEMYAQDEQFSSAISSFETAIGLNSSLAAAHSALGRSLEELGKWGQAERALRSSIALAPTASRYVILAKVQLAQQKEDESEESIRRALELEPQNEEALFSFGLRKRWRNAEEAEAIFKQVVAINRDFAPAYRELGLLLARKGDHEVAERMLRAAVALDGADPWTRIYLGSLFAELGRVPDAEQEYHLALKQEPLWPEPRRLLGRLYSNIGRHAEAIDELKQAVIDGPDDPENAYGLGLALVAFGNQEEGRRWFERALELNPSQQTVHAIQQRLQW